MDMNKLEETLRKYDLSEDQKDVIRQIALSKGQRVFIIQTRHAGRATVRRVLEELNLLDRLREEPERRTLKDHAEKFLVACLIITGVGTAAKWIHVIMRLMEWVP